MPNVVKSICWSMLFLALLLPLALRVLRRLWVKVSIWKRFQPDFLTPIKTLLFKSFKDNVNYNAPGENYFVMLVVILTFSVCSAIAEGIRKRFPEAIDLPDNATGLLGILGFATVLFGFFSFLRENNPKRVNIDKNPGLGIRSVILLIPTAVVIIVLVLAFIYAKFL